MRTISMDLFTFFLVLLSLCLNHNAVQARNTTIPREEDLDLEWQLKLRNQKPVKTVKISAGLYDCIDIKQQPALKHPQLQNHLIQMRPTFLPKQMVSETSSSHKNAIATLTSVDCPQGTIPIRRYKKNDLIRARSFSDSHVSNIHPTRKDFPGQHLAILKSAYLWETQYGIRAAMSLHNPVLVDPTQSSMAEMWVQSNIGDQMNGLQAGWIVSPQLNGDNRTHLFTLTTTDNYKTSCFNTLCGSFVQTDSNHPVDAELGPISVIHGQEYRIDLAIIQDKVTHDWWLVLDGTIHLGYFPASIFTQLTKGGTYIAWGGLTRTQVGKPNPPMGSGHVPFGPMDFTVIASFTNLRLVDPSYNFVDPNKDHLNSYGDSDCYSLRYFGKYKDLGHTLIYGGSGDIPGFSCGY